MNLRPVIEREMLVEARHPGTAWTRLLVALVGLVALLWFTLHSQFNQTTGLRLFQFINLLYFATIWLLIPLLTADALSQERRANTLGLLFLTGLSGREIVLGKSCAHALRGLNLLLAMTPFLIIPVVLGGVSWIEIGVGGIVHLASLSLALAAGMLASAISRSWWRALPLALLSGVLCLVLFSGLRFHFNPLVYRPRLFVTPSGAAFAGRSFRDEWLNADWSERLVMQLSMVAGFDSAGSVGLSPADLIAAGATLLVAAVLAWLCLTLAARIITATWQLRPPSRRALRWQHFWFSTRFLKTWLRRNLRRAMHRNPIAWLHQRSWQARSLKWGWFLAVAFLGAQLLNDALVYYWDLPNTIRLMAVVLLLNLAFTASTSFSQDLAAGTLELLLVSPLSDRLILRGRLRGVAMQYLPALLLLLLVWAAVFFDLPDRYFRLRHELAWPEPLLLFSTAVSILCAGVAESVHRQNALWGWMRTVGQAFLLPALAASGWVFFTAVVLADSTTGRIPSGTALWLAVFCGVQALVAGRGWYVAMTVLQRRDLLGRHA